LGTLFDFQLGKYAPAVGEQRDQCNEKNEGKAQKADEKPAENGLLGGNGVL